ncbi:MAG: hypothetical protein QM537_01960 [Candidatus Symbiobacter sp.]|nr:hypothetical protein [Candidatus Symbiobacter sp.]
MDSPPPKNERLTKKRAFKKGAKKREQKKGSKKKGASLPAAKKGAAKRERHYPPKYPWNTDISSRVIPQEDYSQNSWGITRLAA